MSMTSSMKHALRVLTLSVLAAAIAGCGEEPLKPFQGLPTLTDPEVNRAVADQLGARLRSLGVTAIAAQPHVREPDAYWFGETCQDYDERHDDDCYRLDFRASFAKRPPYAYQDGDLPSWTIASAEEVMAAVQGMPAQNPPEIDAVAFEEWHAMSLTVDAAGVQVRFPAQWKNSKSRSQARKAAVAVVEALIKPLERDASWRSVAPAGASQVEKPPAK